LVHMATPLVLTATIEAGQAVRSTIAAADTMAAQESAEMDSPAAAAVQHLLQQQTAEY